MKIIVLLSTVLLSSLVFSGCNTNGGELFTQALKSEIPVTGNKSDVEIISEAPVKTIVIDGYGKVMTNLKNFPLYTNSEDINNNSTCYDECAIAWPPLTVDDSTDVSGDFGVLQRSDNLLQVTYLGKPLYSYTPDKVRKVSGDGYRGIWSVVVIEKEADIQTLE